MHGSFQELHHPKSPETRVGLLEAHPPEEGPSEFGVTYGERCPTMCHFADAIHQSWPAFVPCLKEFPQTLFLVRLVWPRINFTEAPQWVPKFLCKKLCVGRACL